MIIAANEVITMADQTIEEIERSFEDEWLVIRVTATDREGYATRGEVLSHSPERDQAYEALATYRDEPFLKTTYTGKIPKGRLVVLNSCHVI